MALNSLENQNALYFRKFQSKILDFKAVVQYKEFLKEKVSEQKDLEQEQDTVNNFIIKEKHLS